MWASSEQSAQCLSHAFTGECMKTNLVISAPFLPIISPILDPISNLKYPHFFPISPQKYQSEGKKISQGSQFHRHLDDCYTLFTLKYHLYMRGLKCHTIVVYTSKKFPKCHTYFPNLGQGLFLKWLEKALYMPIF